MSVNKFDKVYNPPLFIDTTKRLELFNIINTLNTSDLLQYSLINKISLNQCNDNDDNLIHVVIRMDDNKITEMSKLNIIKFLVNNNVYPDKPNKNNNTPLHLACELQYKNIVEYLLKVGVNPNFTDNNGNTAFHYLLTGNIKLVNRDNTIKDFIPKTQNRNIKINFTNNFNEIIASTSDINIKNISSYQQNDKKFIIFMNDFTNTSLMKSKYKIDINHEIIKLLLNYKANPYINNLHNISPIHNILKNYNYNIFTELKNIGIDFDFYKYNSDNPKNFIKKEIENNIEKLFGNTNNQLNKILSNITEAHYNEFKALILNNPRFGNNFLRIFENSFNITAYLTFYTLSESLIESHQIELQNFFQGDYIPDKVATTMTNTGPYPFNSSHIFEQVCHDNDGKVLSIELPIYIELQNLLKIKETEKSKLKKKCTLNEYKQLKQEIANIRNQLNNVSAPSPIDINLIFSSEFYIEMWNQYINKNNNSLNDRFNYNLLPLYLLNNSTPLLKQLECICQQYFIDKYINNNILANVYNTILKSQTKLIICHSIKTVILNIVKNFILTNEELTITTPGVKINYEYSFDYDTCRNMMQNYTPPAPNPDNLVSIDSTFENDIIIDKLIKNILNIFNDEDESNTYKTLEVKDIILSDIVNNFKGILQSLDLVHRQALFTRTNISVSPPVPTPSINIDDYDKPINTFINLLENHVVVYFDTIVPKLLTSWLSIVENIFKYIINHSRMLETYQQLNL